MGKTLPPGWPPGVPLPTRQEVEEAVRRVGEHMDAAEQEWMQRRPVLHTHVRLGLTPGPWCPECVAEG